jgi:hypothetical protein
VTAQLADPATCARRRYVLDTRHGTDRIVRIADGEVVFTLALGDTWTFPLLAALNGEAPPMMRRARKRRSAVSRLALVEADAA